MGNGDQLSSMTENTDVVRATTEDALVADHVTSGGPVAVAEEHRADKSAGVSIQIAEALPPLPDIDEVEPLSEKDLACIAAVRKVLEEYGALSRFGMTLLHEHFTIADDEIMMESVDKANRVLTTRPVKAAEHPIENSIETSWRLDSSTGLQRCERYCQKPYGPNGPHMGGHATVG